MEDNKSQVENGGGTFAFSTPDDSDLRPTHTGVDSQKQPRPRHNSAAKRDQTARPAVRSGCQNILQSATGWFD